MSYPLRIVIAMLRTPRSFSASLCLVVLLGIQACVSVAPLEPIKNPPTSFRSDNTVEVEFLSPAIVGIRCGERGTAFYGMPVFHAMACGNGKLITMPDPCETFTGGSYAELLCDLRRQPAAEPQPVPEWQALIQPASFKAPARPSPTPLKPRARNSVQVEFVHPSAVLQRCNTRGLSVVTASEGEFASCGDSERLTVPNPCMVLTGGWYPRTLCHEMAHANGWAMDHPGGSFLSDARAGIDPNVVPPPRALIAALPEPGALRPASQSPAYLAYAAAKDADVQAGLLTKPAVLRDTLPPARNDLRDMLAALSRAQAAVPDLIAEARTLAAGFAAEDRAQMPPLAGLKLRAPSASDVFEGARLFEASLADLTATTAPAPPASDPLSLRRVAALHKASYVSPVGQGNLVMAKAPALPEVDTGVMLAGSSVDSADLPAPMKFAAQQRALVLRRPSVSPAETVGADAVEAQVINPAESAEPAPPAGPTLKPAFPALRRAESETLPAAGV